MIFNYEKYERRIVQFYTDSFHSIQINIMNREDLMKFIVFLHDDGKANKGKYFLTIFLLNFNSIHIFFLEMSEFEHHLVTVCINALQDKWHGESFSQKSRFLCLLILAGILNINILTFKLKF